MSFLGWVCIRYGAHSIIKLRLCKQNDKYECVITDSSFLAVYGSDIREFDTAIGGPTSSEEWREAVRWPTLKTSRAPQPGSAKKSSSYS